MGLLIIILGFIYGIVTKEYQIFAVSLYMGFSCWGIKKGFDTIRVIKNGTNSLTARKDDTTK
jgi:hypothetical protein